MKQKRREFFSWRGFLRLVIVEVLFFGGCLALEYGIALHAQQGHGGVIYGLALVLISAVTDLYVILWIVSAIRKAVRKKRENHDIH